MTYPTAVKQEAIELRLLGATYREISEKCGASDDTVRRWFESEPPDQQAQANNAKLRRQHDELIDATYNATRRVNDRIPHLEDKDLVATLRATSAAVDSRMRLVQDDRKGNSLLEEIRNLLRPKDPAELRTMLTTPTDAENHGANLGLPAISEPLT